MTGSWHIGKIAGIDIRIHWTFLLLPIWIYFSNLFAGTGAVAATISVLFVLAIFGCVVLHELGHSLTARVFGVPTRDITLLPIGGVASLQRMPRNPLHELLIAVAGPAVNVVIAAILFAGFALSPVLSAGSSLVMSFLHRLAWVNVALVVFNMIPAFPMDGGRVLRSLLALFLPYQTATNAAANVGQVAAVGLGLLGLLSGNLILVFIAGFVFLAARAEAFAVSQSGRGASQTDVPYPAQSPFRKSRQSFGEEIEADLNRPTISSDWSVGSALNWLARKHVETFAVVKQHAIIGYVRQSELLAAVAAGHAAWSLERLLSVRFNH